MNGYFNVRPRYAGGSPAMVDERTALRVARDETEGHHRAMEGAYGETEIERAKREGLFGVAEQVTERADAWIVLDLCTGDRYVRPFEKTGEKPIQKQNRYLKLARKYGLPLEDSIKARIEFEGRPS